MMRRLLALVDDLVTAWSVLRGRSAYVASPDGLPRGSVCGRSGAVQTAPTPLHTPSGPVGPT